MLKEITEEKRSSNLETNKTLDVVEGPYNVIHSQFICWIDDLNSEGTLAVLS